MVFVHTINCLLTASCQRLHVRGAGVGFCACSGAGSTPFKTEWAGRGRTPASGGSVTGRWLLRRSGAGAAAGRGRRPGAGSRARRRSAESCPRASNVPLQLPQLPREPVGSGRLAVGAEPDGALGRPSLLSVRVPGGCSSDHGRLQQKAHATLPHHGLPHPCPASGARRGDWRVLLFFRTPRDGGRMGLEQCSTRKGQPRLTPGPALLLGRGP